jgi:hypothetical protein
VAFNVLAAVSMKRAAFWDMKSYAEKMAATGSSETLFPFYRTTRGHTAEKSTLHIHCLKKLNSPNAYVNMFVITNVATPGFLSSCIRIEQVALHIDQYGLSTGPYLL